MVSKLSSRKPSCSERRYLNDYHENVYKTIAPLLTGEERDWLREATRAV